MNIYGTYYICPYCNTKQESFFVRVNKNIVYSYDLPTQTYGQVITDKGKVGYITCPNCDNILRLPDQLAKVILKAKQFYSKLKP